MPYHRRNLYILSSTIFLAALSWQQVMPFLPLFLKDLGVGKNLDWWNAAAFAAHPIASIFAQPFWGKIGDTYGRKPMIIRAGLCLTGIYFGMSFCQTAWQLVMFRFLNGALTGFIPGSFALIATNTPEDEAPHAVASAQTASAAGLILGPAIGGLFAALAGYRGAMRISGTAVFLSTLLVWWLVVEHNKVSNTEKTSLAKDFLIAVRSPILLSIMFALMLGAAFGGMIGPYLALYLTEFSGPKPSDFIVGVIFALPAAAFVLSARRWTRYGEREGYQKSIGIALIGGSIGAVALGLAPNLWTFGLAYFLLGVIFAALQPSVGAITCTRIADAFRGRAYGMQQSAAMLGAFVAPVVAAQISSSLGKRAIFFVMAAILLGGFVLFGILVKRWKKATTSIEIASG